jgi:glycosyltransferase involved in cell wall biosynthesis
MEKNDTRGNILFVSHDASRTGAPLMLLNLLRWSHQYRGTPFRILVGSSGELLSDFEELAQVDLFEPDRDLLFRGLRRLRLHRWYKSRHLARLREKLIHSNIGLVYANSVASAKMVEFLTFLNCPVICHVHELEWSIKNLGKDTIKCLEKSASRYIVVSPSLRTNLVKTHGISSDKIELVTGFIPDPRDAGEEVEESRERIRQELGIPKGTKIVCACGSIEPRKGTDLFLQVACHTVLNYPSLPVHFVWVGGSRDKVKSMRAQVAASPVRDIIHFVGEKDEATPYFSASDVFLLTSREEALPLVMLEAALCHKPTVCFDGSGHPPNFVEQDAGFSVANFDPKLMAEKLVELLLDPGLSRRMGETARDKVLNQYVRSIAAPKIAALIDSLIVLPQRSTPQ